MPAPTALQRAPEALADEVMPAQPISLVEDELLISTSTATTEDTILTDAQPDAPMDIDGESHALFSPEKSFRAANSRRKGL